MIVSYSELELVLNPRIKSRTVHLPFVYGKWGERRPCAAKRGGVYRLRAVAPEERLEPVYERLLPIAEAFPCQRLGVLWLLKECVLPDLSCVVTVREVPQPDGGCWLVRFTKGDQSDVLDKPRLLAARPGSVQRDYTSVPSLALPGTAEEIPAAYQGKLASNADQALKSGETLYRERLLEAISIIRLETARQNIGTAMSRKRLKSVEHQLRAYDREVRRSA